MLSAVDHITDSTYADHILSYQKKKWETVMFAYEKVTNWTMGDLHFTEKQLYNQILQKNKYLSCE